MPCLRLFRCSAFSRNARSASWDSGDLFLPPLRGMPYRIPGPCRNRGRSSALLSTNYYTHDTPKACSGDGRSDLIGLRDKIRRSVLHAADGAPAGSLSRFMILLGRILSLIPTIRHRARYGLPDALGTCGSAAERCLEVGPGQGEALANLRRLGWNAMGLDIDPIAAKQASHVSGCEVREGTLVSTEFPDEYFQSIYMRHVFEHLPNPRPSLLKCFDWLAPGGRLVLVYPNPESLGARRQRDQWLRWDPPRHLVLPSCGAVIPLLQSVGFARISITTSASSRCRDTEDRTQLPIPRADRTAED